MKLSINKLKLKWKIFAFIFGFCALLLVILWLFQVVFLDLFYQKIKMAEIKDDVNIISNNVNSENVSDLIASISEKGDVYIEISSLDGNSILSSADTKYKISLKDKISMISNAKNDNNEFYKHIISGPPDRLDNNFIKETPPNDMQQTQSLAFLKLVKNNSGNTVAVFVNTVITPVNATVTTLRYQLYFVTGIMILLSVFLALLIAKRISKPIEEINKSAKALVDGKYDVSFDGNGFLEVEELSDTLNKAAVELNTVETLRHELFANISHDLRTPLSLIYSYAEMIHDFPDEVTPDQTQVIMDETQRLKTLVDDVLDISKLEAGIQEIRPARYNLTLSIKATVNRIAELVKKKGYNILFIYNEEVFVDADETKITQALYNLLINAINYTGEDKKIQIHQIVSKDNVKIQVTDTGEGITPDNLPYIWDRYYKVDKKHKRAIMGTGLGLSIVKKIIDLHGGNYGVESQVGKGSTFYFQLKK